MKSCVIDIGGGLRGIYGAGVLDGFAEQNIKFDVCIGISAGSANIAAFTAGQKGRNYNFYCDYSLRREYMSASNMLKTGSYIGLDYIYRTLSNEGGEDPLNYDNIAAFDGEIYVVATDVQTGKPVYFNKSDFIRNDYGIICASCAIPAVCRPYEVKGKKYCDGGVSDPVPIDFALNLGCDKIYLIITRPIDFVMDSRLENTAAKLYSVKYPEVSRALKARADMYNKSMIKAKELEKEGKCVIIAPDDCCGVDTLTRDRQKLDMLYRKGFADGQKAISKIES